MKPADGEASAKGVAGGTAMPEPDAAVGGPERLAALRDADLLDTPPEEVFDQLARMTARLLDAPIALVSLVDKDRQFFKSCIGDVPEPYRSERVTPISHSFCRYAVASREPLLIEDARTHPLVRDNPAIRDLGIVAYAGFPLLTQGGQALGTLCVIDSRPRQWNAEQVENLRSLASVAMETISYRSAARAAARVVGAREAEAELFDATDAFAGTVGAYLDALDDYQRALDRVPASGQDLDQEARQRERVLAAEGEARRASAELPARLAAGRGAAGDARARAAAELCGACAAYLEALDRRSAATRRFQRLEATLEEVERTAAEALRAEQSLRLAARAYRLACT